MFASRLEKTICKSVSVIGAFANRRIAGCSEGMPWHSSEDLRRFRSLTLGHSVVMGRMTWEAIGSSLPGRQNVVLTRRPSFRAAGAVTAQSLNEALRIASLPGSIFVIGGAGPWAEALEIADRVFVTQIYGDFEGDVLFPEIDSAKWIEIKREQRWGDVSGRQMRYDFIEYERSERHQCGAGATIGRSCG